MHKENALVLEIFKQDNSLTMGLFNQQEAVSTVRHYSKVPFASGETDKLCQEVVFLLNKAERNCLLSDDSLRSLKKTGQILWDHLLSKPVKEELKKTQEKDLVLSIDEELIRIPWELLFDGENFLCLNFNLGRVVRTKEKPARAEYRSFSSTPRMLILANPTDDLKGAYSEGVQIRNEFDRRRKSLHIDFKSTHIDKLYVKKNLRDYDIVHFAGHCEYEPNDPKDAGWVFSDGKLTASDILNMGETVSLPGLVFSNACYSARAADDMLEADYQERNFSLAQAFLFSGVRHYIGAIRRLEDNAAHEFAREFYSGLLLARPLGECVRRSRLKLIKERSMNAISWASYLLYGEPTFALFKAKETAGLSEEVGKKYSRWLIPIAVAAVFLALGIFSWRFLPSLNPNAHLLFSKAQKLFYSGENSSVIACSVQLIKNEPLFLKTYPQLAQTYLRLGNTEEALKCYFDYALNSEKKRDNRNLCEAYIGIGWVYYLRGEFPKAEEFYQKAITLAQSTRDKLHEAIAMRKLAVWSTDQKQHDRALELLVKSSEINRERQNSQEHRYNLACDYFDFGLVFVNKNDFASAREFYGKSRDIFEKLKLKNELSDYYFNLGEVCVFEKEYQKALEHYLSGLKIDLAQGNKLSLASDYTMIGEAYVEMNNAPEAEKFFLQGLTISQEIKSRPDVASANYNLGLLYKRAGNIKKAREYLRQAQEIYHSLDKELYEEIKKAFLEMEGN